MTPSLPYQNFIKSKDALFKSHGKMADADFSLALATEKIAMHWVQLPPQQKSSIPHAESLEEEFIYVVSGRPHVWINGYIYQLEPGLCVGFPAGTGIAHTFINNSNENTEMVVLGDRTKKENKCSFPINPELQKQQQDLWWNTYPEQQLGPHDAAIGNLAHQKNWQDLVFIKNVSTLERKIGFSYPTDTEKFSEGVRLTDHVGLKFLGVWHEVMRPGKRSSWPHAHKTEEEVAILLKGTAKVWLNGFVYDMHPGDCVFFKPGTGLAHVIFNDSAADLEFLGIGQADGGGAEDKVFYPLNQTRNEQCIEAKYFWNDSPVQKLFGSHFGVPKIGNLEIKIEKDAAAFLEQTKMLLGQREAEYSLLLGLCELRKTTNNYLDDYPDGNLYLSIFQSAKLIGGVCINERNMVISALEEPCLPVLAEFLKEKNINVPGVVGPSLTAEAFARIWSRFTNQNFTLAMGQKIYQLNKVTNQLTRPVTMPTNVSGRIMVANSEHTNVVGEWLLAFGIESLPHQPTTIDKTTELAASKIKKQEVYLWLDDKNQPVSMNFVGRPTENGISVSGVYTPKAWRQQGFASAVVAQTSQKMLDSGKKFCVLYTDVANPTANKIYQQVGYKEIATSKHFVFA